MNYSDYHDPLMNHPVFSDEVEAYVNPGAYVEKQLGLVDGTGERFYNRDIFRKVEQPAVSEPRPIPPPIVDETSSAQSSWLVKLPSGMHRRPNFPPSSCLVWDLMEKQDAMLKPYWSRNTRPEGFRTDWRLVDNLEDLTPPLLIGDTMVCQSIADAESIYDCLAKNGVIRSNKVQKTPTAEALDVMLRRTTPVRLSYPKLKQLEWTIGLLFDLRKFNPTQFQEIHDKEELVYYPLWESYFAAPWGGIKSWFGWQPTSVGKVRSGDKVYGERLDYWGAQREWQQEVWGPDQPKTPPPVRAPSPADALQSPTESVSSFGSGHSKY
jgi:hypothetical protein